MRWKEIIQVDESASAGATGAASVASVAKPLGGIGVGFDPNGHKGIYQNIQRRSPPVEKKK